MKNRGGLRRFGEPWRTVANLGGSRPPRTEPWRRGAVRGANRTVGVALGSVCGRTAPHSLRFEPWSTLAGKDSLRKSIRCGSYEDYPSAGRIYVVVTPTSPFIDLAKVSSGSSGALLSVQSGVFTAKGYSCPQSAPRERLHHLGD